ncbi:hypothetical protein EYB53_001490 [Candidatus Chloroploca sp. M-50]|uniref:Uncharacterized protein n=1 Tax=Candidatus Chloroploca mongolica TaxID=2528176 RepID=A0ABS4D4L2_9CHLR|nr:hypothetical protein [Candidatus Chloroploca mongolica]MBP1464369.1 hypothetical protein [Candidatus Chloroploca mongolica]
MKQRIFSFFSIWLGLGLLLFAVPARLPAQGGGIVVDGADTVRSSDLPSAAALATPLSAARFVVNVNYADDLRQTPLGYTNALNAPLAETRFGINVNYANALRQVGLSYNQALDEPLQAAAFVTNVNAANTIQHHALAFPVAAIKDTVPPQISNPQAVAGEQQIDFRWQNDSYARGEVRYGFSANNLTLSLSDPEYRFEHQFSLDLRTLPSLAQSNGFSGELFYQLVATDQSGNVQTSAVSSLSVTANNTVYLPIVVRTR